MPDEQEPSYVNKLLDELDTLKAALMGLGGFIVADSATIALGSVTSFFPGAYYNAVVAIGLAPIVGTITAGITYVVSKTHYLAKRGRLAQGYPQVVYVQQPYYLQAPQQSVSAQPDTISQLPSYLPPEPPEVKPVSQKPPKKEVEL